MEPRKGEERHSRKVGRLLKIDNSNDNNNNNGMVAIGEVLPKDLSCRGCWWGSFLLYFSVPRLWKGSLGPGRHVFNPDSQQPCWKGIFFSRRLG